jgi:hypothetical protein
MMIVTARRYVYECAVAKGGGKFDADLHVPELLPSNGTSTRRSIDRAGMS